MSLLSLQHLSDEINLRIISYLPKQDKLNLLYTNYHFYLLVQQKLYQNILFTKSSPLKCPNSFEESQYTIIGCLETPLATAALNLRIFEARQDILLESISINTELCKMIKKIVIVGDYNNDGTIETFDKIIKPDLLNHLLNNCDYLEQISSYNSTIPNIIIPSLINFQFNSLEYFPGLLKRTIHSLQFSLIDNTFTLDDYSDAVISDVFRDIRTLVFENEISQFIILKRLAGIANFKFLKLENLKINFYHHFDSPYETVVQFLKLIDFARLDSLELVIGCNDITCDCLQKFTNYLIERNIRVRKLALIQKTMHRDHNYTEAFDMHIVEFLKKYPSISYLKELSINHTPPVDFNIGFGFEGNYLHRKSLFESVIPLLTNLDIFNCPSFMQSIACYEQMISDLLWNGCKCQHCDDYLPIFDTYIMNHKYYDEVKSRLTDMISPIVFGNAAVILSKRGDSGRLIEWSAFPLLNRFWDFHSAPYQITHMSECNIDKSAFHPIAKCIVHFLQAYADSIGAMIPSLRRCILSGAVFDKIGDKWCCAES